MRNLIGTEHISDTPYVCTTAKNKIEVKFRTPKDEVEKVNIIFNDPYNYTDRVWEEKRSEMELRCTDDMYNWWTSELTIDTRRFMYHFELITKDGEVYHYSEAGLDKEWEVGYQFNLPFSHEDEIFTYPDWIDETIWYQIFPDRFATSDSEKYKSWHNGSVTNEENYGGNIKGIISKLGYIKDLGANAIYFTPLFEADSSHKYDTTDYYKIDPQFGTEEDFRNLITAAHEHGIKIMLDGVFNHTSKNHPFFKDVVKNKEKSVYKDWYYVNDYENLEESVKLDYNTFRYNSTFDTFAYTPNMPKLNVANPEAKKYILDAVKYWTEMGIDGWRLDVANEVHHSFWKDFKKTVVEVNPDVYIVGEIWHDSITWLRGDEFHAVMNYKYTNAIIDYFFKKKINKEQFENRVIRTQMEYTNAINKAAFNLFDSHDTMRVLDMCDFKIERLKLGTVFLFTQVGSPCIYYGTEIGITGSGDPDNRKLMLWDEKEWNLELYEFYRQLIKVRKENPILGNAGDFYLVPNNDVCEFIKTDGKETYRILLNNSNTEYEFATEQKVIFAEKFKDNKILENGFVIIKEN